jgi:hypothetical protein
VSHEALSGLALRVLAVIAVAAAIGAALLLAPTTVSADEGESAGRLGAVSVELEPAATTNVLTTLPPTSTTALPGTEPSTVPPPIPPASAPEGAPMAEPAAEAVAHVLQVVEPPAVSVPAPISRTIENTVGGLTSSVADTLASAEAALEEPAAQVTATISETLGEAARLAEPIQPPALPGETLAPVETLLDEAGAVVSGALQPATTALSQVEPLVGAVPGGAETIGSARDTAWPLIASRPASEGASAPPLPLPVGASPIQNVSAAPETDAARGRAPAVDPAGRGQALPILQGTAGTALGRVAPDQRGVDSQRHEPGAGGATAASAGQNRVGQTRSFEAPTALLLVAAFMIVALWHFRFLFADAFPHRQLAFADFKPPR